MRKIVALIFAFLLLSAGPALAEGWSVTAASNPMTDEDSLVAVSDDKDQGRIEIFAVDNELWARITPPLDREKTFSFAKPPTVHIDDRPPSDLALGMVSGRSVMIQLWDGVTKPPRYLVDIIEGRRLTCRFFGADDKVLETSFSLRGSADAINKILRSRRQ